MASPLKVILLGCILSITTSCGDTVRPPDEPETVDLVVRVALASSTIATIVVEVTAPDITTPLAFNLTIVSGVASGSISLPAGTDRTITIRAYDAAGIETHRGSVTISVTVGDNATVTITIEPLVGGVPLVVTIGSFAVTVTPDTVALSVGDTARLVATVVNGTGDTIDAPVIWATLRPVTATIDTAGIVTAHASGTAQVVATYGGVGGSAYIVVAGDTATGVTFGHVVAGGEHTCALTGSGSAFCWGRNTYGELGTGDAVGRSVPTAVVGGIIFDTLDGGGHFNCGLATDGNAYCWGRNDYGQLADGTMNGSSAPVPSASSLTLQSISAGVWPACGVTTGGVGYCWSWGSYGERGDGTTGQEGQPNPVAVQGGLTFGTIDPGAYHTCGVSAGGVGYCWGINANGQLGTGNTTGSSVPVAVQGSLTLRSIVAGGNLPGRMHTCALTLDSLAYCWGFNDSGQVGDSTMTQRTAPVAVKGGHRFRMLGSHGESTCGLTPDGTVYCWGSNAFGQLGNGTAQSATVPLAISGNRTYVELTVGTYHACARTSVGEVYCWGRNQFGQLGNGGTTDSNVPVRVF